MRIGDEICIPRRVFLRPGDLREEMMEEVRECGFGDLGSSIVKVDGRRMDRESFFCGLPCLWGEASGTGPAPASGDGGGSSFTFAPLAFASSCSITWAYISSRLRPIMWRSASTIRWSTYGDSTPGGEPGMEMALLGGKMYGFRSFFSGDGHEKLRFKPPPGDNGVISSLYDGGGGATISTSRAVAARCAT